MTIHLKDILASTSPEDMKERRDEANEHLPKLQAMVNASPYVKDKEFVGWILSVMDYYMLNVCRLGRHIERGPNETDS
jgi:hypothetical protein